MAFVLTPTPPIQEWLQDFDDFAKRSPGFFVGRPVVVDISQMPASRPELVHMVTELKRRHITIMGLDGRSPGELGADARGLPPVLTGGKEIAALSQLADTVQASDIAKLAESVAAQAEAKARGETTEEAAPKAEADAKTESEADSSAADTGEAPSDEGDAKAADAADASPQDADVSEAVSAVSMVTEVALAAVEKAVVEPDADTLIIDHPVRSGQSVVHLTGDVVVIGAVASGSEVVASGSIHIYGALRGRAIAGSAGNRNARIFTTQLNAELVAINGLYKTADDLNAKCVGRAVQAWLDGDTLKMSAF